MRKIITGISFVFMPCIALAQSTGTITDTVEISTDVPVYEYVPKVIIEGKWGTRPGEFGRQSDVDHDFKPESLAVDSKGNIYILDFVNNRIQKFDSNGKHIKSISVEGLKGHIYCWAYESYDEVTGKMSRSVGSPSPDPALLPEKPEGIADDKLIPYIYPPEVQGINIVIDSKDNLYYYLKRIKDGKEEGQVWHFRNDKLVKKWEVPADGGVYYEAPLGIHLEDDDSIWIFNVKENNKKTKKHYEIKKKKKYTTNEREEKLVKGREKIKGEKGKRITPLDRLRKIDLQITENGVKVFRVSEVK